MGRWRLIISYCLERDTFFRSVKTALIVGTILAFINHGQQILSRQFAAAWIVPTLVTYLVPFTVATYGQVQGKRQRERLLSATPRAVLKSREIDTLAVAENTAFVPFWEEETHQISITTEKKQLQFAPRIALLKTMPSVEISIQRVEVAHEA